MCFYSLGKNILPTKPSPYLKKKPREFLRVQKSYIINKDMIKEVHKHFNGRFILTIYDKEHNRVTTGLTYNETVKNAFGLI